ncbi:DUF4864 domain-containing protein [Tumidithrix elongata RA019]|uniref:DUF4864 domain-containing protein n=1 Tax=Tumidithrix elongata BACA0141 TaxID=2716417 RepID=A0AAW9PVJ5_9CYAN|nr:DUF4864 domain-containing protein [Tumidithrix elongata RA019]
MHLTNSDKEEILSVIKKQLEALQKDDAIAAFSCASEFIQAQFGSPATFMDMVKTAYPAVYRPRSVIFEDIALINGAIAQPVLLLGQDDDLVMAYYLMLKQSDLSWKINGCILAPPKGIGS